MLLASDDDDDDDHCSHNFSVSLSIEAVLQCNEFVYHKEATNDDDEEKTTLKRVCVKLRIFSILLFRCADALIISWIRSVGAFAFSISFFFFYSCSMAFCAVFHFQSRFISIKTIRNI